MVLNMMCMGLYPLVVHSSSSGNVFPDNALILSAKPSADILDSSTTAQMQVFAAARRGLCSYHCKRVFGMYQGRLRNVHCGSQTLSFLRCDDTL